MRIEQLHLPGGWHILLPLECYQSFSVGPRALKLCKSLNNHSAAAVVIHSKLSGAIGARKDRGADMIADKTHHAHVGARRTQRYHQSGGEDCFVGVRGQASESIVAWGSAVSVEQAASVVVSHATRLEGLRRGRGPTADLHTTSQAMAGATRRRCSALLAVVTRVFAWVSTEDHGCSMHSHFHHADGAARRVLPPPRGVISEAGEAVHSRVLG